MSALPCGSGSALRMQQQQGSSLVRFRIVPAADARPSSSLLGSRVRIVSYPRVLVPTCPAVLALNAQWPTPRPTAAAMAGRNPPCGRMTPQLGNLASLGAEQWVLEDARPLGSTSAHLLVRIRTAVSLVQRLLLVGRCRGHHARLPAVARPLQRGWLLKLLPSAVPFPQIQPQCFWYLGAPASCTAGAAVQLYSGSNAAAATVWRLIRVG